MEEPIRHAVLFYDGESGMCNQLGSTLLHLHQAGHLHYAPLQRQLAQACR